MYLKQKQSFLSIQPVDINPRKCDFFHMLRSTRKEMGEYKNLVPMNALTTFSEKSQSPTKTTGPHFREGSSAIRSAIPPSPARRAF